MLHQRRRKHAHGEPNRGYKYNHKVMPRVSLVIDPDTFGTLVAEATQREVPLNMVVREKIAAGMKVAP